MNSEGSAETRRDPLVQTMRHSARQMGHFTLPVSPATVRATCSRRSGMTAPRPQAAEKHVKISHLNLRSRASQASIS